MVSKIKALLEGLKQLKAKQIMFLFSGIRAIIIPSFLYALNSTLPILFDMPIRKASIFIIFFFILFGIGYFLERFWVAFLIKFAYEKKPNIMKTFSYAEKTIGNFVISSFLFISLASLSFLASQILTIMELGIFFIVELIVLTKLLLYEYAIVIEEKDILESFRRSWKLTENNFLNTLTLKLFFATLLFGILALQSYIVSASQYAINFYLTVFLLLWLLTPWEICSFVSFFEQLKNKRK